MVYLHRSNLTHHTTVKEAGHVASQCFPEDGLLVAVFLVTTLREAIVHSVRGMTMKALGIHLLIELWSCDKQKIDNLDYLENIMSQAAEVAGATVLKTAFQDFNPQGVSGVVVIAESHLTIHTWPEYGYAAVDIFTCGTKVDPWKAVGFLKRELEAGQSSVRDFQRGIPESQDSAREDCGFVDHAACGNPNC